MYKNGYVYIYYIKDILLNLFLVSNYIIIRQEDSIIKIKNKNFKKTGTCKHLFNYEYLNLYYLMYKLKVIFKLVLYTLYI